MTTLKALNVQALLEQTEPLTAKQMGTLADEFWTTKTERLAVEKQAKALKTTENAIEAKLIEQMLRQEVTAAGGKTIILTLPPPKQEPAVTSWPEFWEFSKAQNDMSLFEKRPGRAAIKERWEAGEVIPGVSKFPVYSLSKQGTK